MNHWYDECVANSILQYSFKKNLYITPIYLQKLLYYIIGFYYKYRNKYPLQNDFFKWNYSPAVPSIYKNFKKYKNKPIIAFYKAPKDTLSYVADFEDDFAEIFSSVLDYYSNLSDNALFSRIKKHTAWRCTNYYTRITKEAIKYTFDNIQGIGQGA